MSLGVRLWHALRAEGRGRRLPLTMIAAPRGRASGGGGGRGVARASDASKLEDRLQLYCNSYSSKVGTHSQVGRVTETPRVAPRSEPPKLRT